MKAGINTPYNRYVFRSKTEARWALLFDTLGVSYEYEPKTFTLPKIGGYIPDFFLSENQGGSWIEVKGTVPNAEEEQKAIGLCKVTNQPVYIFSDNFSIQEFSGGASELCNFGIYVVKNGEVVPLRSIMSYTEFLPQYFNASYAQILEAAKLVEGYNWNSWTMSRLTAGFFFNATGERRV